MSNWKCTDPDRKQFGRRINKHTFAFKEDIPDNEDMEQIEMWINLNHYSEEEKRKHISAYYDSLKQLKEVYGDDSDWIIAECIFEQESGLY